MRGSIGTTLARFCLSAVCICCSAGSISFLPKSKKAITRVGVMASGFLSWLLIFGYITR
jgi:hypothetical protein